MKTARWSANIFNLFVKCVGVPVFVCADMRTERVKSLGKAKQADRTSKEHLYKEAAPLFPGFLFRTRYELCNFRKG